MSMPNERTCREMLIPQRMGPAGSIKSDQETIPRRVRLPATEPRQLLRTRTWYCCSSSPHFRCCQLRRIDDIGEKNCCQSSIRLGTGRIPREKFLDPIEQRVRISHVWGKQCRRVATRYDKPAANYLAFVQLASNRLWLRANASTPWMIDVPETARFV